MTKERIREFEDMSVETSQTEKQRGKVMKTTEYLNTVDVNNFKNIDNSKM